MNRWCVDGQLFEILLCQFSPGSETQALHQIRKLGNPATFLPFAEFDLAAIVPQSLDDITSNRYLSLAPGLRDFQRALCFGWEGASWALNRLDELGPAVAFTFVKLNERVVQKHGIHAEWAVISSLKKELVSAPPRAVTVVPYGTLGWAELLLVVGGPNFAVVIEEILALRRVKAGDLAEILGVRDEGDDSTCLFVDTHTIPCLRIPEGAETPYDPSVAAGLAEAVTPSILVASSAGHTDDTLRRLAAEFGESLHLAPTFGYHDLILQPAPAPIRLPYLVSLLGFVRNPDRCPGVLTTQVLLSPEARGPDEGTQSTRFRSLSLQEQRLREEKAAETRGLLDVACSHIRDLAQFEAEHRNRLLRFGSGLAQIILCYLAVRGVEEFDGLVDDLDAFIEQLLWRVEGIAAHWGPLADVDRVVREAYEFTEDIPLLFKFGFDQRLTGARVGITNTGRGFTGVWPQGVQRLIGAASALPRYLLTRADANSPEGGPRRWWWYGFVVFGYSTEALRLDEGIMNLPAATLMDPAEWWMLCHEAGHELCAQLDPVGYPSFQRCIETVSEGASPGHPGRIQRSHFAEELIDELVAEAFSFVTLFDSDWDFYLRAMWNYLQDFLEGRANHGKIEEYLIRSAFVLFFHLEWEGALGVGERVRDAIQKGQGLRANLFASDPDAPAYTPWTARPLRKNIVYRGFAGYASVADIIHRQIVMPALLVAPKIAAEIGAVPVERVADMYETFETIRSDVTRMIASLVPPAYSASAVEEPGHDPVRGALDALLDLRQLWKDPARHWAGIERARIYKHLSRGDLDTDTETPPPRLVAALKQARMTRKASEVDDPKAVLACILSLWHRNRQLQSS